MGLLDDLLRCNIEIEEMRQLTLHDERWLLGLKDWYCERNMIMTEIGELRQRPLNALSDRCHAANMNWWINHDTGQKKDRNVGELLMLCVSELSEALEGHRKDLMDDKLPTRKMIEVELADCMIRIFDLAGAHGMDLDGAFEEKMEYNARRADHKPENRALAGGKKY